MPKITATAALCKRLSKAQLEHTRELLNLVAERNYDYGDDTHDDVRAALALSRELVDIAFDEDVEALEKLLNATENDPDGLASFACGGICEAIYDLHPAVLADEED